MAFSDNMWNLCLLPSFKPPPKIHHASLRWKKITLWVGRDLSQIGVMFGQTFDSRTHHLQSRPLLVMTRVETWNSIYSGYNPSDPLPIYTIYKAIYRGCISLDNITSRGLRCISIDDQYQACAFPSALSPRLSTSNRKHRTDAFTFPAGAGRFVQESNDILPAHIAKHYSWFQAEKHSKVECVGMWVIQSRLFPWACQKKRQLHARWRM